MKNGLRKDSFVGFALAATLASTSAFADAPTAPLMVQPQLAQAGSYIATPLQIFGSTLNASCMVWLNGAPCPGLSATPGELDCSLDTSKMQGPSTLDLIVSCLDSPTQTLKSAVQIYPALAVAPANATILPGENVTLTGIGGVPPYRFHLPQINPCLSLDEKSGELKTAQSCDIRLRFNVQIQDSVGETTSSYFTFDQAFHASLPADWNSTSALYKGKSFQVGVQGGLAPFHYEVLSGPATIDANAGNGIGGDQAGPVIIRVTDAKGLQNDVQSQNYLAGFETSHSSFSLSAKGDELKGEGFIVQDPQGHFYLLRTLSHIQVISNHDGSVTDVDTAAHPSFVPFPSAGGEYQNAGNPIEITQSGNKLEGLYSYLKQIDGKHLLGAATYDFGFLGKGQHPVIYRLNPDFTAANSLDTSFGSGGILQFEIDHKASESVMSMVEASDGTIYAGVLSSGKSNVFSVVTISSAGKILSKTQLGSLNSTFPSNIDGQIQLVIQGGDRGGDVLAAFDSDKGVEMHYVNGSQAVFKFPSTSGTNCRLGQVGGNSGKVFVTENCTIQPSPNYYENYGQLLGFHWDGSIDTSVGVAGTYLFQDPQNKQYGSAPLFYMQADGKIFCGAHMRFNADGQPDSTFYQTISDGGIGGFFETDREMLLYHPSENYITIDGVSK